MLRGDYVAAAHAQQTGAFLVEGLPFYRPRSNGEYVFILGFNHMPLPGALIRTLAAHPELVPDSVRIYWMEEQELIFEGSLAEWQQSLVERSKILLYFQESILYNRGMTSNEVKGSIPEETIRELENDLRQAHENKYVFQVG